MISDVENVLGRFFDPLNPVRLSPSGFMVLVTLARFNRGSLGISQMSLRRIKELTGLSKRTVIRALRELHQKGYLLPLKSQVKTQRPMAYMLLPEREAEKGAVNQAAPRRESRDPYWKDIDDLFRQLGEIF